MSKQLHDQVVPYEVSKGSKKAQVEEMFDNISGRYDLLNRILSARVDKGWRKRVLKELAAYKPKHILDLATGTGDLAIDMAKLKPEQIIGGDISMGMLEVGRQKIEKEGLSKMVKLERADAENLQYGSGSFDAVTVAFGVRNFENLLRGLQEMFRVLKPGGAAMVLEFSKPESAVFRSLYYFYLRNVLPRVGKMVSRDVRAYAYLAESIQAFPSGQDFLNVMKDAGFSKTRKIPFTFGICTLYIGEK